MSHRMPGRKYAQRMPASPASIAAMIHTTRDHLVDVDPEDAASDGLSETARVALPSLV